MFLKIFPLFLFISVAFNHQCRDESNKEVDWFYVYKLPQETKHENSLIAIGAAYAYMTSNDNKNGWKLSKISINDTKSIIGLTLYPLFDSENKNDLMYILYNDELPNGLVDFKHGHTKGVVLGNKENGLWLVHSVPKFPSTESGSYFYSHNGYSYGQSFLCISFDLNNLNKIGKQLQYNEIPIYQSNMPDELKSTLPDIFDAISKEKVSFAPDFNLVQLTSMGGKQFSSFAKGHRFNKDLYEDWLGPALNSSFLVETWLNGPGRLPSDCNRFFKIKNVEEITISEANISFKSSTDHSKWAVTDPDNLYSWICVGDINRAKGQEKRGGGTICFPNKVVATAYQKSVKLVEHCTDNKNFIFRN